MAKDSPTPETHSRLSCALPASRLDAFTVQGKRPHRAAAPRTPEEIAELLRTAQLEQWAVVPYGSGSRQDLGNPPDRFDLALATTRLDRIPEYEPQDLVVRVESGCRLGQLQELLAADRLCLPVDPPAYRRTTLGGMVATNASGPGRFGHGTLRDYLLGVGVVQADGSQTRFGSRVVKNVTGYDMCKLYTGSFGTLGVFSDFYFKLKPLPPTEKTVLGLFRKLPPVRGALSRLLRSPLTPIAVEFLDGGATGRLDRKLDWNGEIAGYALAIKFGDLDAAVAWQVRELKEIWGSCLDGDVPVSDSREQARLWDCLREDRFCLAEPPLENVTLKVNILPNQLVQWIEQIESHLSETEIPFFLRAHAGSGVVRIYCHLDPSSSRAGRLAGLIEKWRSLLKAVRGSVVIERGPAKLKNRVDAWGYRYKDVTLMRQIKNRLDPREILNPGRFVV
ncbi:MAG: FAD-binding oxidoreductase [Acidobacteriota bacterium]|nr:FAD-binding oxidoreductase [Acidobacteriota bacterium]